LLLPLKASVEFTADEATVSKTVLDSGVRILTEHVQGAPSVAISVSVGVGSRDESMHHLGSTHFLEHLLFKGTSRRSALDISIAFDSVGGSSNAATAKEYTSYYARVQNSAINLATDVLLDMFTSAKIDQTDFETEKTVILEELAMNDDDPEDVAHEAFSDALMPNSDLGRPIGGSKESILAVTREQVVDHYRQHYAANTLIVAAAGGVEHAHLVELVQNQLELVGWKNPQDPIARRPQEFRKPTQPERFRLIEKDTQQSHLSYSDSGFFGLYAGCNSENAEAVIKLMREQLEDIASHGVSDDEFTLAIGNITGSLALRFEASMARMNRLVGVELGSGEYLAVSEVLDKFQAQTKADVLRVANRIASAPSSLVAVGQNLSSLEKLA